MKKTSSNTQFNKISKNIIDSYLRHNQLFFYSSFILQIMTALSLFALMISVIILEQDSYTIFMISTLVTFFLYLIARMWSFVAFPIFLNRTCDALIDTRHIILYQEGVTQHHFWMGQKLFNLAKEIGNKEMIIKQRGMLSILANQYETWLTHRNLQFKQHVFELAASEYVKLIQYEPLNKQLHLALIDIYTEIAQTYITDLNQYKHVWSAIFKDEIAEKQATVERFCEQAIQECQIIESGFKDEKQVYIKKAHVYRLRHLKHQECEAIKKYLSLEPDNLDLWYKLGILYFQIGETFQGLEIYKKLTLKKYPNAKKMTVFYESHKFNQ